MGNGCIQMRSRNSTVERERTERCGQEVKENNAKVWSVTPEERYGQIVHKEKRSGGLISVERCVREDENSLGFYFANSEENLIAGVAAAETINTGEYWRI